MDLLGKSDPYTTVNLTTDPSVKIKTPVIKDKLDPEWNYEGNLYLNLFRCQAKNA
jgi:hypothetical protein